MENELKDMGYNLVKKIHNSIFGFIGLNDVNVIVT